MMIRGQGNCKRRLTYRFVQFVTWLILRTLFRIRVEGIENIPGEGGVIIASNHASLTDPPGLGCVIPREVSYFAKKELFKVPIVGPFIAWANGVSVDREGGGATALKEMLRRLQDGWAVLVFPEGTRTRTGDFLEPKSGAGMAAVMAGVPVVPCWIEGSFRAKPFRSQITFHFLPPFHPDDVLPSAEKQIEPDAEKRPDEKHPEEIRAVTKKEQYLLVSRRIMYDISKLYNSQMAVRNQAKSPER